MLEVSLKIPCILFIRSGALSRVLRASLPAFMRRRRQQAILDEVLCNKLQEALLRYKIIISGPCAIQAHSGSRFSCSIVSSCTVGHEVKIFQTLLTHQSLPLYNPS